MKTVSTLHKQNFDLKLELFHRRQRQTALEERLEAAEAQLAEQAEMQAMNEQLVAELEKRDQAIEEAMSIIAALESRVERLEDERNAVRSINGACDSGYFSKLHGDENTQDRDRSTPKRCGGEDKVEQSGTPSRAVPRMPSFLSDQSEGADALRSLYMPDDKGRGLLSVPSLSQLNEENGNGERPEETDGMNSPRLSVLSESSFVSVYGEKNLALEGLDLSDGAGGASLDGRRHRKSSSIEKWVDGRVHVNNTAPKRVPSPKVANLRKGQFNSILDILESPQSPLQVLERTLKKNKGRLGPGYILNGSMSLDVRGANGGQERGTEREVLRRTEMTSFGRQHVLPPTPDTISTNTLRRYKNSNETLGRGSAERGLDWDHTRDTLPLYGRPTSARPHSAGETVTSRREGHGWDTVTQSEVTETSSDVDVETHSAFDPWIAMGREKPRSRIQPPNMFTFTGDDEERWGRDMMFNHDDGMKLPPLRNYERSGTHNQEPQSEDTIVTSSNQRHSHLTYDFHKTSLPGPSLSNQSSPNPPERKSSLAISPSEKRPRKALPLASHPVPYYGPQKVPASIGVGNTDQNPKRSRITSKLFGISRSESLQAPSSATAPFIEVSKTRVASDFGAHQAYNEYARAPRARRNNSVDSRAGIEGLHGASATPPPISRYPRRNDGSGAPLVRPTTASSLESKLPRRKVNYEDGFGHDGAREEREPVRPIGNRSASMKSDSKAGFLKLLGLGKGGSLRR